MCNLYVANTHHAPIITMKHPLFQQSADDEMDAFHVSMKVLFDYFTSFNTVSWYQSMNNVSLIHRRSPQENVQMRTEGNQVDVNKCH